MLKNERHILGFDYSVVGMWILCVQICIKLIALFLYGHQLKGVGIMLSSTHQCVVGCAAAHATTAWTSGHNMNICRVFLQCAPVCAGPVGDWKKKSWGIVDTDAVSHPDQSYLPSLPNLHFRWHPWFLQNCWSLPYLRDDLQSWPWLGLQSA